MRVRQLQMENFRAFRKAEIHLPGTGLVLVAGSNNAGKTALLSALDVLAGDHGDLASLRYGGAVEPARLSATFVLVVIAMIVVAVAAVQASIPVAIAAHANNYLFPQNGFSFSQTKIELIFG